MDLMLSPGEGCSSCSSATLRQPCASPHATTSTRRAANGSSGTLRSSMLFSASQASGLHPGVSVIYTGGLGGGWGDMKNKD